MAEFMRTIRDIALNNIQNIVTAETQREAEGKLRGNGIVDLLALNQMRSETDRMDFRTQENRPAILVCKQASELLV